jgi:hypothetical protein
MSNVAHGVGSYAGPDRRRHRVFVTRNSEYHCRDGVCLAVLSKETGAFETGHAAIGRQLTAGVRFDADGAVASISPPDAPRFGDQLCFSMIGPVDSPTDVITSPVRSVERPARAVVLLYSLPRTLH